MLIDFSWLALYIGAFGIVDCFIRFVKLNNFSIFIFYLLFLSLGLYLVFYCYNEKDEVKNKTRRTKRSYEYNSI